MKNAIVLTVVGKPHMERFLVVKNKIEEYARLIGCKLIIITKNNFPRYEILNKFNSYYLFSRHERILYLDTDIVINTDKNIFDEVPKNSLAIYDESYIHLNDNKKHFKDRYKRVCDMQNLRPTENLKMFNSGVMLVSKKYKSVLKPPRRPFSTWVCFDQYIIYNRIINNRVEVFELDKKWNYLYTDKDFWKREIMKANFIHLNGCFPEKERVRLMHQLSNKDFSFQRHFKNLIIKDENFKPQWI